MCISISFCTLLFDVLITRVVMWFCSQNKGQNKSMTFFPNNKFEEDPNEI